jgi:hypothetical protein
MPRFAELRDHPRRLPTLRWPARGAPAPEPTAEERRIVYAAPKAVRGRSERPGA